MSQPTARTEALELILLVVVVAGATALYYVIPVPGQMREGSWAVLFFGGLAALGVLILLSIRRMLRAGEAGRIRGLILLLTLTVLFFSWADESVAQLPGQFADLHTKTDAIYFTISTLATVGFGDVHPVGQLARAAVTVQIVFNLVFLGAAVSIISGFMRARAHERMQPAPRTQQPPAAGSGPGTGAGT